MLRFLAKGGDTSSITGTRGTVNCEAGAQCYMSAEKEGNGCPRFFATGAIKPIEDNVSRKYTLTEEFKAYTDESCEPFAKRLECYDADDVSPSGLLTTKTLTYRDYIGISKNVTSPGDDYADRVERNFSTSDNCGNVRTTDCWPNGNPDANNGWIDQENADGGNTVSQFQSTKCEFGQGRSPDNPTMAHVNHDTLVIVHNDGAALPARITCQVEGPKELCFGPPTGLYTDADFFEQCGTQEIGPPGYRDCNGWNDPTCKVDNQFHEWLPDPHVYSGGLCKKVGRTAADESGLSQPNPMLAISLGGSLILNISMIDPTFEPGILGTRYEDLANWGIFGDETNVIDGSYDPYFFQSITIDVGCGALSPPLNVGDQFGMLMVDGFLTMDETNELPCGTCEGADPLINSVCIGPNQFGQKYNAKSNICDGELPIYQQSECPAQVTNETGACLVCGNEPEEPEEPTQPPCACAVCFPGGGGAYGGSSKVRPDTLVFRNVGGSPWYISNQQEGKASVSGSTLVAGTITAGTCSSGTVAINGDVFSVTGWRGADVVCTITAGGGRQTVVIHASCSKALNIGDQFGAVELIDFSSDGGTEDASTCSCEPEEPVGCDVCFPGGAGSSKVRPTSISFRNTGGGPWLLSNRQEGKASVVGSIIAAGTIISATCQTGTVTVAGDMLTVSNWRGADIRCSITAADGIQAFVVHASCSKALEIGDHFGALRLTDFTSQGHVVNTCGGGGGGTPNPYGPGPGGGEEECDVCYPNEGHSTYTTTGKKGKKSKKSKGMGMGKKAGKVKVDTLVFTVVGGAVTDLTNNQDGKASVIGDALAIDDVTQASCATGTATVSGDTLTISGWRGADASCTIGNSLVSQTITIHASCSKPLLLGYQFGAIELSGFGSNGGAPVNSCPANDWRRRNRRAARLARQAATGGDRITSLTFAWQNIGIKDITGNMSVSNAEVEHFRPSYRVFNVVVTPTDATGYFGASTDFTVFGDVITLHTSCSTPLYVGQELRFSDGTLTLTGFITLNLETLNYRSDITDCQGPTYVPPPENIQKCMCLGANIPLCLMGGRNGTALNAALNDYRIGDGVPPACCKSYWYGCAIAVGVGLNYIKPTTGRPNTQNAGFGSVDGTEGYMTVDSAMINLGIQIDEPGCDFDQFGKNYDEGINASCYTENAFYKHIGGEGFGNFDENPDPGLPLGGNGFTAAGDAESATASAATTIGIVGAVTVMAGLLVGAAMYYRHTKQLDGRAVDVDEDAVIAAGGISEANEPRKTITASGDSSGDLFDSGASSTDGDTPSESGLDAAQAAFRGTGLMTF